MCRGKDRPGNRRRLPAALGALIEIAGRHQTILLAAADRALEATRPACRNHNCLALFLGAVLLFERRLAEPPLGLHDHPDLHTWRTPRASGLVQSGYPLFLYLFVIYV